MSKVDPSIILDAIVRIPADGLSTLSISVHYKPNGTVGSVFFYRNHNKHADIGAVHYEDSSRGISVYYADYYLKKNHD